MKTIAIILFVLTAVALACKGQDVDFHDHDYMINPFMPRDCVELISAYNPDEFFLTKPTERGDGVTSTMVLTRVYKKTGENQWKFCGWLWMDADNVTELHIPPELQPETI